MTEKTKEIATATSLMRMALALLDKAGEGASVTACHLQAAINAGIDAQALQAGDDLNHEMIERLLGQTEKPKD